MNEIATAMQRAASVYERRPGAGLHDDAAGSVRWVGGLRMEARHAAGHVVLTDISPELGGAGDQVSPGWLVRSGVAACAATTIVAVAAERGVALAALDVQVTSRSDARGYLGMSAPDGAEIAAGPVGLQMHVRISAPGVSEAVLRDLVAAARRRAPMTSVVEEARGMATTLEIEAG